MGWVFLFDLVNWNRKMMLLTWNLAAKIKYLHWHLRELGIWEERNVCFWAIKQRRPQTWLYCCKIFASSTNFNEFRLTLFLGLDGSVHKSSIHTKFESYLNYERPCGVHWIKDLWQVKYPKKFKTPSQNEVYI